MIWQILARQPNRFEPGPNTSGLKFAAAGVAAVDVLPLKLVGAWVISSPDPRFGGFSGLALDRGQILAVTDQGSIARFSKPGLRPATVLIRDLHDGPYNGRYGWNRDAEALARDPLGRGWWVAFEKHHELWLYDSGFTRGLKRITLGRDRWETNLGVEGLAALPGPELLLFPETGGRLFRMRGGRGIAMRLEDGKLLVSEATLLPDGRLAGIERLLGVRGFENSLVTFARTASGYRVADRIPLDLGLLDNVEGLAGEALPDGVIRLWMISDDNFQRPLRTLLLAMDLPPDRKGP